jgi:hypothetical protein
MGRRTGLYFHRTVDILRRYKPVDGLYFHRTVVILRRYKPVDGLYFHRTVVILWRYEPVGRPVFSPYGGHTLAL